MPGDWGHVSVLSRMVRLRSAESWRGGVDPSVSGVAIAFPSTRNPAVSPHRRALTAVSCQHHANAGCSSSFSKWFFLSALLY